jgi:hypothetical protein
MIEGCCKILLIFFINPSKVMSRKLIGAIVISLAIAFAILSVDYVVKQESSVKELSMTEEDFINAVEVLERWGASGDEDCLFAVSVIKKASSDFSILKKQAEQGDGESLYSLGLIYDSGVVPKNSEILFDLYSASARQGEYRAQETLGDMYLSGMGIKQDVSKSVEWFEKSAGQGNDEALEALEYIFNQKYYKCTEFMEQQNICLRGLRDAVRDVVNVIK